MSYYQRPLGSHLGILELERRRQAVATADPGVQALASQRYNEAQARYDVGDYEGAIRLFTEAWTLVPHPSVLLAIGATMRKLGRFQDAMYRYQRYIRENPDGDRIEQARDALASLQVAMEQQAAQQSVPPPTPPPEVPQATLAARRTEAPTPQQVMQTAPSPRTLPPPYEARRATYGIWIATGVGVLGLVGLGWWTWRQQRRPKANQRRRRL